MDKTEVDDFKAAWRRLYALKAQVFPDAKLVWCPNDGTTADLDVRLAYPGSDAVDLLGVVTTNAYPFLSDASAIAAHMTSVESDGAPLGIEQWRQFAESKKVPMAVCAWSSQAVDDGSGSGGGDAPAYMEAMYQWLIDHGGTGPGQVVYEILFNQEPNNSLYPNTLQPLAAQEYIDLW